MAMDDSLPVVDLTEGVVRLLDVTPESIVPLTVRSDRLVARVHLAQGDLLLKVDLRSGAFDREVAAMARLGRPGLPVSTIVESISGPPSMLVATWADGRPIAATDSPSVLAHLGGILRTIHAQPEVEPFSGHPTIRSWISSWLRSVVAWWVSTGRAPADAERQCEFVLARVVPVLDGRRGSLILFDGRPEHMLVDQDGSLHLIDVADAMSGDPIMDFAVLALESPELLGPVLHGYDLNLAEAAAQQQLLPLYAFIRALAGAEWHRRMNSPPVISERYLLKAVQWYDRLQQVPGHQVDAMNSMVYRSSDTSYVH